ncbi:MAG: ATP-binding protein [Filomicrobium sp.]
MSLRSTLVASIMAVALITLLFGAAISYWHAQSKVSEEMEAAIAVGARISMNAVDDAEESKDPSRRLHLLVADFNGDRHLRARWLDTAGRIIARSAPAKPSEPVPKWFEDIIRQPERSITVKLPPVFEGLGKFVLETDSRNEIGEVWQDIWNTLMIVGLLSSLVLACVYWLVGRALRPLDKLAVSFAQISRSKVAPKIAETGPAELVQVYRGFNDMAERLTKMEDKNRRLTEQLSTVQEEERADLARDLHDEIGPFLFSADVDAASIGRCVEAGKNDEIKSHVSTLRDSIGHMQRHVKDLLGRLRSRGLVDVGLVDAVENLTSFWKARYPEVEFDVDIFDGSYGEVVDLTVFRIIQESLSNAMRHGRAKHVEISVTRRQGGLAIQVRDNGRGFTKSESSSGFGIIGMRERLAAFEGTIDVAEREDGTGVVVRAWLPVGDALEQQAETPINSSTRKLVHEQA